MGFKYVQSRHRNRAAARRRWNHGPRISTVNAMLCEDSFWFCSLTPYQAGFTPRRSSSAPVPLRSARRTSRIGKVTKRDVGMLCESVQSNQRFRYPGNRHCCFPVLAAASPREAGIPAAHRSRKLHLTVPELHGIVGRTFNTASTGCGESRRGWLPFASLCL